MKVVFVSNYYNHHQSSFSEAMWKKTGGNYYFVENEVMEEERKSLGWGEKNVPAFVLQAYKNNEEKRRCIDLINSADLVMYEYTTTPLIRERLASGKLTFLYSERVFKSGYEPLKIPVRLITWHKYFGKYKNLFLLCASAYTSSDFFLTGNFLGKAYKWGYFPKVIKYHSIDKIIEKKQPASIVWVARLIDWKHPELPIKVAKKLKEDGYQFEINMIGNGELENDMEKMIDDFDLQDCVHLLGSMSPKKVRTYMEQSQIFMFTSDRNEGWGAVLNESMNSGCAVVANHKIGSVPFLLKHKKNGLIYKDGDFNSLYRAVKFLLDNKEICSEYGKNAYDTVTSVWNAENAADCILKLYEDIKSNFISKRFINGPCSKAELLWHNWFSDKN